MKVIAKVNLKNSYSQILFLEGKEYETIDKVRNRYFVLNELHSETSFTDLNLDNYFYIV